MTNDLPGISDETEAAEADLAEQRQTQDNEVLEREGFEQELLDRDLSEVGTEVDDVQRSVEEERPR
jgi:hypothetical protein